MPHNGLRVDVHRVAMNHAHKLCHYLGGTNHYRERASDRLTSGNTGLTKALAQTETEPLFRVSSLSVEYDATGGDVVHALRGGDLEITPGQTVGVLGESGSGKSSLALALLRLLPANTRCVAGSIEYRGAQMTQFTNRKLREMRGGQVALISQEPALALNPVLTLGTQIRSEERR